MVECLPTCSATCYLELLFCIFCQINQWRCLLSTKKNYSCVHVHAWFLVCTFHVVSGIALTGFFFWFFYYNNSTHIFTWTHRVHEHHVYLDIIWTQLKWQREKKTRRQLTVGMTIKKLTIIKNNDCE